MNQLKLWVEMQTSHACVYVQTKHDWAKKDMAASENEFHEEP